MNRRNVVEKVLLLSIIVFCLVNAIALHRAVDIIEKQIADNKRLNAEIQDTLRPLTTINGEK